MLLLTGPYGYDAGDSITLSSDLGFGREEELEYILLQYSCYEPAIAKIKSCLRYSGRYDCTVQPNWFRHHAKKLKESLAEIGVDLTVNHMTKKI